MKADPMNIVGVANSERREKKRLQLKAQYRTTEKFKKIYQNKIKNVNIR